MIMKIQQKRQFQSDNNTNKNNNNINKIISGSERPRLSQINKREVRDLRSSKNNYSENYPTVKDHVYEDK